MLYFPTDAVDKLPVGLPLYDSVTPLGISASFNPVTLYVLFNIPVVLLFSPNTFFWGKEVTVINAHASNAIGVFPASGDTINALSQDAVYALAATKTAMFFCAVAGTWNTILTA